MEKRKHIKFRVKIGKSASKMLVQLTVAYDESTVRKLGLHEFLIKKAVIIKMVIHLIHLI